MTNDKTNRDHKLTFKLTAQEREEIFQEAHEKMTSASTIVRQRLFASNNA